MSATRSSRAFIKLSWAPTTTFPAKWLRGRKRHVTARPKKHDTPSRLYRKRVPMTTSIGESIHTDWLSDIIQEMHKTVRTDKCEDVPCKLADTVYIGSHKRHNLRLASKLVFIFLLLGLIVTCPLNCFPLCSSFCCWGRRTS